MISLITICFKYINDNNLIIQDLQDKWRNFTTACNASFLINYTKYRYVIQNKTIESMKYFKLSENNKYWIFKSNSFNDFILSYYHCYRDNKIMFFNNNTMY